MADTYIYLSGSASGQVIPVAATGTPGTLIHTTQNDTLVGPGTVDCVYLWASNVTGVAATLTVEWGGVAAPGDHLIGGYTIAANSLPIVVADGQVLAAGQTIRALSGTANAINISGYVIRRSRVIYAQKVGGPTG
jgi:hypothetical protein